MRCRLLLVMCAVLGCGGGGNRTGIDGGEQGIDGARDTASDGGRDTMLVPDSLVTTFVDPFIGTDDGDSPDPVPGDVGGATFPGATVPFGMVQWSPDTVGAEFSYHHKSTAIHGFSLNHLSGPGCPSLLDFPFLPVDRSVLSSAPDQNRKEFQAAFSHARESSEPGFYRVTLDSGIDVRLTASTRTGLAQVSYPEGSAAGLLLWAGKSPGWGLAVDNAEIRVTGQNEITASLTSFGFCNAPLATYRIHLVVRFDQPFSATSTWQGPRLVPDGREAKGPSSGIFLRFPQGARVMMRAALSYVSVDNARKNLVAEDTGGNFESVRAAASSRWERLLGRVRVEGGSVAERTNFYTALYHSFLHPNVFSDVNGEYAGFDRSTHVADGYVHYANFSGWDIYRSWVQLAAVLAPAELGDMTRSLLTDGQQCGALPKWALANDDTSIMVGDPGSILLSTAYAFGVRGFDAKAAVALMADAASTPGRKCNSYELRHGLDDYLRDGFVPAEHWGGPAVTLEYALADFAISRLAMAVGEEEIGQRFTDRARNWHNVFDLETGYVRPRSRSKAWLPDFDPASEVHFIEGNAAQYTFFVPHDVPGLIEALGGPAPAVARLDDLFQEINGGIGRPYFYMGNEPQFSTPWLYDLAGAPWKTQEVVRRIVTRAFGNGPTGLPGNDDLGSTSSWYAWAVMGLYPAVPAVAGFTVGSPLFERVTIDLGGGRTLEIRAKGATVTRPYVRHLELDGAEYDSAWIPWERLSKGAILNFDLDEEPDRSWGSKTRMQ